MAAVSLFHVMHGILSMKSVEDAGIRAFDDEVPDWVAFIVDNGHRYISKKFREAAILF